MCFHLVEMCYSVTFSACGDHPVLPDDFFTTHWVLTFVFLLCFGFPLDLPGGGSFVILNAIFFFSKHIK